MLDMIAAVDVDVARKDVVVAVLGASAALAGFALVFLGQLIAVYRSYGTDTVAAVKSRHRTAAWPVFGAFCLSVATIGVAFLWLATSEGACLYGVVLAFFSAELVAIVGVAMFATKRLLR